MMIPNGDQFASEFLRREPHYDESAWIDAYAMSIGRMKPELSPAEASRLAIEAYAREGSWNNPKVAASCDVVFGPLISPK